MTDPKAKTPVPPSPGAAAGPASPTDSRPNDPHAKTIRIATPAPGTRRGFDRDWKATRQILSPEGKMLVTPPLMADTEIAACYKAMVLTRALDERGMGLQRQGRIGFYLPSTGEEALQIGTAACFEPKDWIFPSYRVPGVALWRGITPEMLFDNCFGNVRDTSKGKQMPVHYAFTAAKFVSISSPIGTQIVQAVGAGMAAKIRKDPIVVAVYFGDGGTSSNDFHTGMNFAAVTKAPVLFICQNNRWAISCPYEKQSGSETIVQKAVAYGMEGIRCDGNDFFAVVEATRAAVAKARAGGGPTLIECVTYRMGPHSSSDDPTRYRPAAEYEEWKLKDPIARLETWAKGDGLLSDAEVQKAWAEARERVNEAAKAAQAVPQPPIETVFQDVYAEMPPHLREQMEAVLKEGAHANTSQAFPL